MSIISKETFEKFSEEEKSEFRKLYNEISTDYQNAKEQGYGEERVEIFEKLVQLEDYFGKENLQPEPKIKTWKNVVENNSNCNFQEYLDSITEGPGMALGISPICKKNDCYL